MPTDYFPVNADLHIDMYMLGGIYMSRNTKEPTNEQRNDIQLWRRLRLRLMDHDLQAALTALALLCAWGAFCLWRLKR